jgi:Protein of unknown function (DUF3326)
MLLVEREFTVPQAPAGRGAIAHFAEEVQARLGGDETPVRFAVTQTAAGECRCEVGLISGSLARRGSSPTSIFEFRRRSVENNEKFNVVLLVPTGIGAEIGGHAGDATPVARLLASTCDRLITHPNVVNASDVNEMSENTLYVEGSVICRLLMGSVGLQPVRSNRVLVVLDDHDDEGFTYISINSVSAARASYGLKCPDVVLLDPPLGVKALYAGSGRASGRVDGMPGLIAALDARRDLFDAVAVASIIEVPSTIHQDYFQSAGDMVNPWGGVEAILTHAVSLLFDLPSAHSPMLESQEIADEECGIVDPRMAAEAISLGFLQCILKGLQRSPRLVTERDAMRSPGVLSASDVSCLVIPDGCVGLPTLAALEQGIPVIAVRENTNLMRNDLSELPWAPGQLTTVDNYWEAAGVLCALKAGIAPESVRRPLRPTLVNGQELLGMPFSEVDAAELEPELSGA